MMKVTVVGTGYVGLVTGACISSQGHEVVCVDVQPERVECIGRGEAPFYEPGLNELIVAGIKAKRLSATGDLAAAMTESDISIIAVGTPARASRIDLSYVEQAAGQIGRTLSRAKPYHVIVVKSTVVPGTTDTLVRKTVEAASGRKAGEFGLCMNPEFLREGFAVEDFMYPDRIVIGEWDSRSGDVLAKVYDKFDCPVLRLSLRNAEMIKYSSNALLATLISFSNEFARLCESLPGTDVDAVMDGLHLDRRLSPVVDGKRIVAGILVYLRAGAGYGGSCLPKDVAAIRAFAGERSIPTPLLDAVAQINRDRPREVVAMLEKAMGGAESKTVAVLGLAFKAGTDDLRESPALKIVDALKEKGIAVRAHDPLAMKPAEPIVGKDVKLCADAQSLLDGVDAAVIATAWPEFVQWDWQQLVKLMRQPIVLDARNALRKVKWAAGVMYLPIGVVPAQAGRS
jgi:UDPglucose 6-dehydrogenase/GDP-mannose 6-dehydrogenase